MESVRGVGRGADGGLPIALKVAGQGGGCGECDWENETQKVVRCVVYVSRSGQSSSSSYYQAPRPV